MQDVEWGSSLDADCNDKKNPTIINSYGNFPAIELHEVLFVKTKSQRHPEFAAHTKRSMYYSTYQMNHSTQ